MNTIILVGRVSRAPEVRYTTGESSVAVAKYSLAVDRRGKDKGVDFFNITAFGKAAEFAERYFQVGTGLAVTGRVQTGSYVNKDGIKVHTFDIISESVEFCGGCRSEAKKSEPKQEEFVNVPDDVADDGLPFN